MSKGPGRIERSLAKLMEREPDNAFTSEELVERIYRYERRGYWEGAEPIGPVDDAPEPRWVYGDARSYRAKRVAVVRAIHRQIQRNPHRLAVRYSDQRGNELIVYDPCCIKSYAMARAKACCGSGAREQKLRDHIERHASEMRKGGDWWKRVQLAIAERDGDPAAAMMRYELDREKAQRRIGLWKLMGIRPPPEELARIQRLMEPPIQRRQIVEQPIQRRKIVEPP